MSINVTPIPRLIDLAAPAFTLGTANAAGSAVTAVASDATLLAFDAVAPAAVAASAVVGTSTVSARRDHVHPGTTGAGTVVDEAITRFNGTGGSSLQGYSSRSPTISDAGILTLTSGALAFPATAIASTNANTLDDYEEGTWTAGVTFGGNNTDLVLSVYGGLYTKIGDRVFATAWIIFSNKGSSSGNALITGLPFTSENITANVCTGSIYVDGISYADSLQIRTQANTTTIELFDVTNAGVNTQLQETNFANGSALAISLNYEAA
jgi:hypothetical protein|tara:strand:- start:842 stop:1639 length:798 start_codon:yes stop_codon:yes gene_type:complete